MDKFIEKLEKAIHFVEPYAEAVVASIAYAVIALLPSFLTGDLYRRLREKLGEGAEYGYCN